MWNKKRILFTVLEGCCYIVAIALIFLQYGAIQDDDGGLTFKIGFGASVCVLFLFWIMKKSFIDKLIQNWDSQNTVLMAQLKIETDEEKLDNIKVALRKNMILRTIIGSIVPLLLIVIAYLAFYGVEKQLVSLRYCMLFIGACYIVSLVFAVLAANSIGQDNTTTEDVEDTTT